MAVLRWGCWPCLVVLVLASSFSISSSSDTVVEEYQEHQKNSLQEVKVIPSRGTTQVCVVPLDSNVLLRVVHVDTDGRKQEVPVRRKSLNKDTLNILDVEVQASDGSEPGLSVRLNGTKLPGREPRSPAGPVPQQPRTTLLLKGYAKIAFCPPAAPAREGREMPRDAERQMVTPGREAATSSASPVPSFPTDASFSFTSEETGSVEEDPWWSFLLVLGTVGEVPVLALLMGSVLLGALLGGIVVCFCSKACEKRRVEYHPVNNARKTASVPSDVIRMAKISDIGGERRSATDSAFGTLNTDTSSHMGTGVKPSGNFNNSIDRSTGFTSHHSVNNLGRGTTGSPSGSTYRSHNSSANNTLNIPNSSSMTRFGSHQSTGHSHNKVMEGSSMFPHGSDKTRTFSDRGNAFSINKNINRSPNIPYTKTLGTLTGHQDPLLMVRPNGELEDNWDSEEDANYDKPYDGKYDKPYISSPQVLDEYSVPHVSEIVMLERQTNANAPAVGKLSDGQVRPFQNATFK